MISSGNNTYFFQGTTVLIVSSSPGQCACGRTSHIFKNHNGQTRCLDCAHLALFAATECDPEEGPDAAGAFQKAIV